MKMEMLGLLMALAFAEMRDRRQLGLVFLDPKGGVATGCYSITSASIRIIQTLPKAAVGIPQVLN